MNETVMTTSVCSGGHKSSCLATAVLSVQWWALVWVWAVVITSPLVWLLQCSVVGTSPQVWLLQCAVVGTSPPFWPMRTVHRQPPLVCTNHYICRLHSLSLSCQFSGNIVALLAGMFVCFSTDCTVYISVNIYSIMFVTYL